MGLPRFEGAIRTRCEPHECPTRLHNNKQEERARRSPGVFRVVAPPTTAGVVCGRQPGLTVIGIGDSISTGIGVETQSESLVARVAARLARGGREVRWLSVGLSGATAPVLHSLLDAVLPYPRDILLLSCRVNDVVRRRPAADFGAAQAALFRQARARWPKTCIVHAGIPPLESFPALGTSLGR